MASLFKELERVISGERKKRTKKKSHRKSHGKRNSKGRFTKR